MEHEVLYSIMIARDCLALILIIMRLTIHICPVVDRSCMKSFWSRQRKPSSARRRLRRYDFPFYVEKVATEFILA